MPSLVLKNIPERLHRRLKDESKKHRRSMMQEAIVILEESLACAPVELPEPVKPARKLTQAVLSRAIETGRE
ncbi:MAG TPA: plasmid stability protein [Spirochaetota bacterium]|nr:plasmid stability protein [Spirochaetota bacterium]HNT11860.1 plasmid stability protein [Spirochaetota bacterium]